MLEVGIAQSSRWVGFHRGEQLFHYLRRCTTAIKRAAAQARPVAGVKGIVSSSEEFNILALGSARVTDRPAKDPGRPYGDIEDSVKSGIALAERAVHYFR